MFLLESVNAQTCMDVDVAECVVCLRHRGKEPERETQDCLFLALVALTKSNELANL